MKRFLGWLLTVAVSVVVVGCGESAKERQSRLDNEERLERDRRFEQNMREMNQALDRINGTRNTVPQNVRVVP